MIDARATILQLRALIGAGDFRDMEAIRRVALRSTSGVADKDRAGKLQDDLLEAIELTAMLAEMNEAAGNRVVFWQEPMKVLDEIEAALTQAKRQE